MSKIFEALRETNEGEDVHISSEDLKTLVTILQLVSSVLESGKLYFNEPGPENKQYAEFCHRMAHKFANIKIEAEQ